MMDVVSPPAAVSYSVASDVLGPVTVRAGDELSFPRGVFGFPACTRWVLVAAAQPGFFWLQSVEHAALAFLLVDPFEVFPGYGVELTEADLRDLRASSPRDVVILSIVTLPRTAGEPMTANLQGPVAIDLGTRRGRQLVVQDPAAGARRPLPTPVLG